jgi:hypothetical protein
MPVVQRPISNSLKTRWHSGGRAGSVNFGTPLTRNEIVNRLRPYRGTNISGGLPFLEWQVVASPDAKGFFILMRGDLTSPWPLTATCRWIPADSGTAFEATIVPALSGRTVAARIAFTVAVLAVYAVAIGAMSGSWLIAGVTTLIAVGLAFWVSGFVVPKNTWDHDVKQCEVMSRFFRETLDAAEVEPGHKSELATT